LPRRSIQQRALGESVEYADILAEDLVFVSGFIDYYHNDPADGVGHVGIATGDGTVVHAANRKVGVVETPLSEFVECKFRGIRRYVPSGCSVLTLETPVSREVETSGDVRWIVMQSLPQGVTTA